MVVGFIVVVLITVDGFGVVVLVGSMEVAVLGSVEVVVVCT